MIELEGIEFGGSKLAPLSKSFQLSCLLSDRGDTIFLSINYLVFGYFWIADLESKKTLINNISEFHDISIFSWKHIVKLMFEVQMS